MAFTNLNNEQLRRIALGGFIGDADTYGDAVATGVYAFVTADTPTTVETAHYFDAAVSTLNVGDVIWAVMTRTGTPVFKGYVVTVNDGTHVTIVLQKTTTG